MRSKSAHGVLHCKNRSDGRRNLCIAPARLESCMAYISVNPNDGSGLKSFEHFTQAQLELSLAEAERCFQSWKHSCFAQRAVVLNKAAALLRAYVNAFARLATLEMGKRVDEARAAVVFSADPGLLRQTCAGPAGADQSASPLGCSADSKQPHRRAVLR